MFRYCLLMERVDSVFLRNGGLPAMETGVSERENVAVIMRLYSRLLDAEGLVRIINTTWTRHNYTLFVAHNGAGDGFVASDALRAAGHYVPVATNAGHIGGATALVQAGYRAARACGDFSAYLFIEADFWLVGDALIDEALSSMRREERPVASTIWVERNHSLAVDFLLMDGAFLRDNPELLDWDDHPEQYLSARLYPDRVHIIECLRPTHVPGLLRLMIPFGARTSVKGRFRLFPKAPALTHHLENLSANPLRAIAIKRGLANTLAGRRVFDDPPVRIPWQSVLQPLSRFVPQSSWFKKHCL